MGQVQGGLRICLFGHRLAQRHPTGIGRYTVELVRALSKEVSEPSSPTARLLLASTHESEPASWVPEEIEVGVVRGPRRPVQLAWCLGSGPRLESSLGRLSAAHLIQPFPPVRSAAPQLVTVHDLFPFEHPDWYRRSERWTYRRSMSLVLRRAARIVVPSAWAARRLEATCDVDPSRIQVVHLGISGAFGQPRTDDSGICARHGVAPGEYAISLGAVSTRKNIVPVIRASAELGSAGLALLLVGPDGVGAERVEHEIRRVAPGGRVRRTGYLPDADTAALVRNAAVLVHPTLGEGFGFVPLEAMAVGTPVIAAGVSAVPEVAGEGAVLIDDPSDPRAWASAIRQVLDDGGMRASLVAAGRAQARRFSWQKTAQAMMRAYADVAVE